jgi:transposase
VKRGLRFVRGWVDDHYADRGRPSIDPVVFFKLQLVMFFEGIHSERQLIETASLNLAHRWSLGYALNEELPDHSSLTRIRQRLGIDVFQRFFEKVVDLCQETGLVRGRELSVDATRVRADADADSFVPRFSHEAKAHLADVFTADPAPAEVQEAVPAASSIARSTRITSRRCAVTTPPRPTRRRCTSAKCGWSRCSPRPRTGMAYVASGGEGLRTSISRAC